MKRRLVTSCVVVAVLALQAAADAQSSPTRVPYQLLSGQIVVQASIGDNASQPAILDTSVPRCLVTQDAASKLFLVSGDPIDMPTLYGPVHIPTIPAQELRIGALPVPDVAFAICNLWKQLSSDPPKDAPTLWIGTSALEKLSVTIDPASQTIILADPRTPFPRGAVVVPFDISDGRVQIEVRAEGMRKYRAIVTTGAAGTLLPASVARALKLKTLTSMPVKHPDGKMGSAAVVQLKRVTIGPLDVPEVPALTLLDGDFGGMDPETGVIGTDILLDYRVTFNFPQRRIAFETLDAGDSKPTPQTAPEDTNRRVMTRPGGGADGSLTPMR